MPKQETALEKFETAVDDSKKAWSWQQREKTLAALTLAAETSQTLQSADDVGKFHPIFWRLLLIVGSSKHADVRQQGVTTLSTVIANVAQAVTPQAGFDLGINYAQSSPFSSCDQTLTTAALQAANKLLPEVLKNGQGGKKTDVMDSLFHLIGTAPACFNTTFAEMIKTIIGSTSSAKGELAGLNVAQKAADRLIDEGTKADIVTAVTQAGLDLAPAAIAASTPESYTEIVPLLVDLIHTTAICANYAKQDQEEQRKGQITAQILRIIGQTHEKHGAQTALFAVSSLLGDTPLRTSDTRLAAIPVGVKLVMPAMTEAKTAGDKASILGYAFALDRHADPGEVRPTLVSALENFYGSHRNEAAAFVEKALDAGLGGSSGREIFLQARARHSLVRLSTKEIVKQAGEELGLRFVEQAHRGLSRFVAKWQKPAATP